MLPLAFSGSGIRCRFGLKSKQQTPQQTRAYNIDAITGTYFSFITLSTIGFGDVVPGTAMNQWNDEEKLVLCAMYLVFGLSLIHLPFPDLAFVVVSD
jgi:hypothetical protein